MWACVPAVLIWTLLFFNELLHLLLLLPQLQQLQLQHSSELESVPNPLFASSAKHYKTHYCHSLQPSFTKYLLWKPAGKIFSQSIFLTRPSCLSCFSAAIMIHVFFFLFCIAGRLFPYRSEALQGREALFPSGGGFLEGLVPLEEFLDLVHGEPEVFTGHVGLLSDQPGLRHRGVPRKLTHLQHWRR